jgi:uncharacterized protein (TIGR00369 family)
VDTESPVEGGTGQGDLRRKEITWQDPLATAGARAGLTGREFLERIAVGRLPPPPILELVGAQLLALGDGEASFRATPDESVYNPIGMVHGGFLCTLLDSAAGCAVHTLLPAGSGYSTIEIKVSFLKPVRAGDQIEVVGRSLRVGRQVAFAEAHARNAAGDLVGHATSSLVIFEERATQRPRRAAD